MIGIAAAVYLGVKNYQRLLPSADRGNLAIVATQAAVQRSFGTGIAIRFGPRESTRVESSGGGFKVSGWVQAVSADGSMAQAYAYSCQVTQNLVGNWTVANLNLDVTEAPVSLK